MTKGPLRYRENNARARDAVALLLREGCVLTVEDLLEIRDENGCPQHFPSSIFKKIRNGSFTSETGVPVKFQEYKGTLVFRDSRFQDGETDLDQVCQSIDNKWGEAAQRGADLRRFNEGRRSHQERFY